MQGNHFRKTRKTALVWSCVCLDEINAVQWKRQHNQVVWTRCLQKKMTTREGEKAPGMPITNNLFLKNQPPGPVIPKILIFKYLLKGGFEEK